jgi:hypothetical protein
VEDEIQRARLRFESMLASAQQAAEWAAQDRPGVMGPSTLLIAAAKAMNRAGGFLEAVIIMSPELGVQLLDEFETFASRVDNLSLATKTFGERRTADLRRERDDRRAGDRRLRHERRHLSMAVTVERRNTPDRRGEPDRRTGKIRELADRRWRAIQQ